MEKERTDITAVSKADLEVCHTRETSIFNGYHKSLNRNFYVDMSKQSLPLEMFERTMQPCIIPSMHIAKQLSPVERDIATTLRDIAASPRRLFSPTGHRSTVVGFHFTAI